MNRIDKAFIVLLIGWISAATWIGFHEINAEMRQGTAQEAQNQPQNYITIHRTYSDIDGREMAWPVVYVVDYGTETRYDGETVIVRQLKSGAWWIKIGEKEFTTRDKRESVTYFDLGPSPDNPGAIRS